MTAKQQLGVYAPDGSLYITLTDGAGNLASAGGGSGSGDALKADPLSQFAATTSLQLKGVISDETGSGALVFATSPTLVTPLLGTPTSGVLTNCTGTASGLTVGNVTGTGVGSLTSLAIGGATIGSDALAVTGVSNLAGTVNVGSTQIQTGAVVVLGSNAGQLYLGVSNDVNLSRNAAGVLQVGTTAANASGSLLAATLALGGATIGTNALAVNGTSTHSAKILTTGAYSKVTANVAFGDSNGGISFSSGGTFFSVAGASIASISTAGGLTLNSTSLMGHTGGQADTGSPDVNFNRASAGVYNLGTTAANALGSLNLTNLTATGNITFSSGGSIIFGTTGTPQFYNGASNGVTFRANGTDYAQFNIDFQQFKSTSSLQWSSGALYAASDLFQTRAAAATLQLGAADVASGAVAQTLTVQSNTGTTTTGPDFTIYGSAGTTSGGSLILGTAATTTKAGKWKIDPTGHLLAITDNTYDIGASASTRPRTGYFATSVRVSTGIFSGAQITFTGGPRVWGGNANTISLDNGSGAPDNMLVGIGGITATNPALKRNATVLEVKLGDDSAYTQIYGATVRTSQTTVAGLPSASTSGAGARAFVTDASTTLILGLGGTVSGGGANKTPVYSDGTNWIYG